MHVFICVSVNGNMFCLYVYIDICIDICAYMYINVCFLIVYICMNIYIFIFLIC